MPDLVRHPPGTCGRKAQYRTLHRFAGEDPVAGAQDLVEALIVLPICATTVVLLIQDSLALAFGLAALVAAVRFRVRLPDALDGIYIFAAICVGLASGIGYLGVAVVMTIFFCFASIILWGMDYGANPVEAAKQAKKLAQLEEIEPGKN